MIHRWLSQGLPKALPNHAKILLLKNYLHICCRMVWEHFSSVAAFSAPQKCSTFLSSLMTEKSTCSPLIWYCPFPYVLGQAFKVTVDTSFLSRSFVFNIHSISSNLFATVFTEATASIQGVCSSEVAGSTLYFQKQHEEDW